MNPEDVLKLAADAFQIPVGHLMGGRRTIYRTRARWAAAHLLRRTGAFSYSDIARILHYKDHTSARAGVLAIRKLMAEQLYLRDKIKALEVALHLPAEIINQEGRGEP